jgi:peptidoglycan hydrolase-like protein with peptidoglycan-binding domain
MSITAGSPSENIKTVQKLLQKVGAYTGSIDGVYGQDMIEAIFQFQKKQGIVVERSDDGAGLYGPKTRTTLKSLLTSDDIAAIIPPVTTTPTTSTTPTSTDSSTTTPATATPTATPTTSTTPTDTSTQSDSIFGANVFDGAKSEDIRSVQKMLKELGYFNYDIDGLYNKRLVDSIYAFQLEKKIVDNATEQ